jgi:hypothetical protein
MGPPSKKPFPNPGTDRRDDELKRNLHTEAEIVAGHDHAVETDRVADEDREAANKRSSAMEKKSIINRRMIDLVAIALLILVLITTSISILALVAVSHNADRINRICQSPAVDCEP